MKHRKNNLVDAWDGRPLVRYWKPNSLLKLGEQVQATRMRKITKAKRMWPGWTHDVWTGRYQGYGQDENGTALFRSMKNAVAFASAAYRAGYRIRRNP